MSKIILISIITLCSLLQVVAQDSLRVDTTEVRDDAIIYPESMTEQLNDLLRNWQLDLSKADLDCERGANVTFPDSVYLKRLHNLPSVMELSFNSVVKDYIEMYAVRRREQVSYMLALGEYYFPIFEQALDRHGLPLELKCLPIIESALNPTAVSRAGATGLWQFMLRTGKSYGLEVNSLVDERRDPYKSTDAAVRYLKDLYAIYGDWNLVIAAYNCGPGNVNKAIARSGGKRDYWQIYYRLPKETRGYVPAFIAANYIMNYYSEHNICPAHASSMSNIALDTIHVNESMHLEQIASVVNVQLDELKRLNPQFKKEIVPGDYKPYALVLPTEKMGTFIAMNDSILNYKKDRYFTHRANTDGLLNGTTLSSESGNSTNVYYRVRKGDNLSTIAKRHGTTVSRLKSWNGLRTTRLSIGKQLIVGKKAVPVQQETAAVTENEYKRVEKSHSSDIISTYLKSQMEKLEKE